MTSEEFQIHMITEMAVLKTHMLALVGNGQPGRISNIERTLVKHDHSLTRAKGWAAGAACILTVAWGILEWYFHVRGH
jgi:hypothetical protein